MRATMECEKYVSRIGPRQQKPLEIVYVRQAEIDSAMRTAIVGKLERNKIKNFSQFLFLFQLGTFFAKIFIPNFRNRSGFRPRIFFFFFSFPNPQGVGDFDYVNSISMGKTDNLFCAARFGGISRDQYTRSTTSVVALYSRSFRFEWKSNQGPLSVANNEFDEITTPFCVPFGRIGQYQRCARSLRTG